MCQVGHQSQSLQETDLSNINLDQLTEPELAQLSDEQILTILQQNNQPHLLNYQALYILRN